MRKRLFGAFVGASALAVSLLPTTTASASGPPLYKSGVPLSVGNVPSYGAEAYAFNEFGNEVNLTSTKLGKVVLDLSTWGCQTGHWNTGDCGTTAGAKFSEPITFNIYNPPALGSDVPGSLIATRTQTFSIPYRPSANYAHCTGSNAGKWWDKAVATCFNGKLVAVSFSFGLTLPTTDIVFGITYNTSHFGYFPYGENTGCYTSSGGCGYDSLNIALSQDPTNVTAGSDRYPGTVFQNTVVASNYCDNGAAGTGIFRLDSPSSACWGGYIPAVTLNHS